MGLRLRRLALGLALGQGLVSCGDVSQPSTQLSIAGAVFNQGTGEPIENAGVFVLNPERILGGTITNADGRFYLFLETGTAAECAEVSIGAQAIGHAPARSEPDALSCGMTCRDIRVELDPFAGGYLTFEGVELGQCEGGPLPNTRMDATSAAGG